jgi:hypothetical protein
MANLKIIGLKYGSLCEGMAASRQLLLLIDLLRKPRTVLA